MSQPEKGSRDHDNNGKHSRGHKESQEGEAEHPAGVLSVVVTRRYGDGAKYAKPSY